MFQIFAAVGCGLELQKDLRNKAYANFKQLGPKITSNNVVIFVSHYQYCNASFYRLLNGHQFLVSNISPGIGNLSEFKEFHDLFEPPNCLF